jgi:hypothetical protein
MNDSMIVALTIIAIIVLIVVLAVLIATSDALTPHERENE